jgi:hypothetical protein
MKRILAGQQARGRTSKPHRNGNASIRTRRFTSAKDDRSWGESRDWTLPILLGISPFARFIQCEK